MRPSGIARKDERGRMGNGPFCDDVFTLFALRICTGEIILQFVCRCVNSFRSILHIRGVLSVLNHSPACLETSPRTFTTNFASYTYSALGLTDRVRHISAAGYHIPRRVGFKMPTMWLTENQSKLLSLYRRSRINANGYCRG